MEGVIATKQWVGEACACESAAPTASARRRAAFLLLRCSLFVLCLAVLQIIGAAHAQTGNSNLLRLTEYQKDNWQVEAGLPSNDIHMIVQQRDGRLLLATAVGLCTFDGRMFEPVDDAVGRVLGNEPANAVLVARDGSVWVGTDGQGVLHQSNGRVENVSRASGRLHERVRMLYQDAAGAIWIATQNGVERYWDGHLQAFDDEGMIAGDLTMPFADDGSGGVLMVTSSGLFDWMHGSVRRVTLPSSLGEPTAVYRDGSGREWLGTMRGVVRLTQHGDSWSSEGALLPTASPVTTMLADRLGALWLGSRRNGLYRESRLGWEHYGVADGLQDGGVKSLFLDDENNLWIGTLTGGLSRWREGAFAPYGQPEGFPSHYAGAVFADSRGTLWLGTWDKGLFQLQNGHLAAVTLPGNPRESPIRAIAEDRDGHLWVGTWFHGVYRYEDGHFRSYLLGTESPGNAVSTMVCDRQGGLWIGTYQGVLYYPGGIPNGKPQTYLRQQLVTTLVEDTDGSLLAGTGQGLSRLSAHGNRWNAVPIRGLQGQHILSVFVDRLGTAWAASLESGLVQLSGNGSVSISSLQGARRSTAFPAVYSEVDDSDGNLWLGTARGILRVPLVELHQLFTGQTRMFSSLLLTKDDGMRSSDCSEVSQPSSTRMPDGTLWFTTAGGYVHSTPVAETVGTINPPIYVRGWTAAEDQGAASMFHGAKAVLQPDAPEMLVYFWAKRLSNAEQVEFRYRLAGYDHAWTETRARVARYRRLPPGRYQFDVQARVGTGPWPQAAATLLVVQKPHLYQTWYFLVALILLLAAGAWVVLRMRIQRRMQRVRGSMGIVLEERNRIAQECHDTLMAGFAAISWQLEATANLFRESDAAATPAAKSCELARSMVLLCQAEARRIIYDLRETEEVTNALSKAIRRMLEENYPGVERDNLHFEMQGAEVSLPPGSVHHLTRITQEAVRNALRHATPSAVWILLDYRTDTLRLLIRDDGCGFVVDEAPQARSGHFGIAVMQERARKVGATLRLHSDPSGTEVETVVPFDAIPAAIERKEEVVQWIGL
jgi:ligand-binding sensor domain-containing protein/signal transduction histidine kinase